jgi:transposase
MFVLYENTMSLLCFSAVSASFGADLVVKGNAKSKGEKNTFSRTTEEERLQILQLHFDGLTKSMIAENIHVNQSTVCRWIQRYEREHTINNKPVPGRPRATTERDDKEIVLAAKRDHSISLKGILNNLDLNCGKTTVFQRLKESGELKSSWESKKPDISKSARKKGQMVPRTQGLDG